MSYFSSHLIWEECFYFTDIIIVKVASLEIFLLHFFVCLAIIIEELDMEYSIILSELKLALLSQQFISPFITGV